MEISELVDVGSDVGSKVKIVSWDVGRSPVDIEAAGELSSRRARPGTHAINHAYSKPGCVVR